MILPMRIATVLLAVALSTIANAATFEDKDGSLWHLIMPPERFLSGDPSMEVRRHVLPRDKVETVCLHLTAKPGQFGCALVWPQACDIYLADDMPEPFFKATEIHERSHCHGWPADHPTDAPPTSASMDGFISNIERILSKGDRRAPPDP